MRTITFAINTRQKRMKSIRSRDLIRMDKEKGRIFYIIPMYPQIIDFIPYIYNLDTKQKFALPYKIKDGIFACRCYVDVGGVRPKMVLKLGPYKSPIFYGYNDGKLAGKYFYEDCTLRKKRDIPVSTPSYEGFGGPIEPLFVF